jgi:hypothetical protein
MADFAMPARMTRSDGADFFYPEILLFAHGFLLNAHNRCFMGDG